MATMPLHAAATRPAEHGSDVECAVCMEPVVQRIVLPCNCNLDFCFRCWDRCLAQSFIDCGMARCPTCRCPVHVDFIAESGTLSFRVAGSTEAGEASVGDHSVSSAMERLIEQARPAQIRILHDYGVLHALPSQGGAELSHTTLAAQIESLCADSGQTRPNCACGSHLVRLFPRERALHTCKTALPRCPAEGSPELEVILDRMVSLGMVASCDLCSKPVEESGWMCNNGNNTILHACSYDVCDSCFVRYCFDRIPEPTAYESSQSLDHTGTTDDSSPLGQPLEPVGGVTRELDTIFYADPPNANAIRANYFCCFTHCWSGLRRIIFT